MLTDCILFLKSKKKCYTLASLFYKNYFGWGVFERLIGLCALIFSLGTKSKTEILLTVLFLYWTSQSDNVDPVFFFLCPFFFFFTFLRTCLTFGLICSSSEELSDEYFSFSDKYNPKVALHIWNVVSRIIGFVSKKNVTVKEKNAIGKKSLLYLKQKQYHSRSRKIFNSHILHILSNLLVYRQWFSRSIWTSWQSFWFNFESFWLCFFVWCRRWWRNSWIEQIFVVATHFIGACAGCITLITAKTNVNNKICIKINYLE